MAAPSITWLKHTSAGNTVGIDITGGQITLGTVTAGHWGTVRVISAKPVGNSINHTKFWLSDSLAVLAGGGNVSLGNSTRKWWFKAATTTALVAGLFTKTGASVGATLACDYYLAGNHNSAGAGISVGRGANNTVTSGVKSKYIFISPQPSSLAYDGTYTDFAFQVSYDFT